MLQDALSVNLYRLKSLVTACGRRPSHVDENSLKHKERGVRTQILRYFNKYKVNTRFTHPLDKCVMRGGT